MARFPALFIVFIRRSTTGFQSYIAIVVDPGFTAPSRSQLAEAVQKVFRVADMLKVWILKNI